MSLNEGALDDLDKNALFDPDLVKTTPDAVDPNKEPIIIVSDPNQPLSDEERELNVNHIEENLDADISFKVVTEQVEKTVELAQVAGEFDKKDSISRTDAEYATATFEGLTGYGVHPRSYSMAPSRVGLESLKKGVRLVLSTEEAKVVNLVKAFVQGPLQALYKQAEAFANVDSSDATLILIAVQEKVSTWLNANNGIAVFVRTGGEMMPLSRTPLSDIKLDLLDVSEPRRQVIKAVLEACKVFENGALRSYMTKIAEGGRPDEIIGKSQGSYGYPRTHVTIETVLSMLASPTVVGTPYAAKEAAQGYMVKIATITEEHNKEEGSFGTISDFVSKHGGDVNEATRGIHEISEITQGLTTVSATVLAFMDEMDKKG